MSQAKEESETDSEYEEEEATILVELKGVIDSDLLTQMPFEKFKLIGLETDNPILQLNNYCFSGEYDETLGTALIFEEEAKKYKKSDPIFCNDPTTRLKYVCHTTKVLNMRRIFIAENKTKETSDAQDEIEPMDCDDSDK